MNCNGYTPLHASILTSTLWCESHTTRIVWFALLALKDRNHFVAGSIPGLASVARVTVDECRTAIESFLAPDPDSRTKEHEGRRIQEVDGGWIILNGPKFRPERDPEKRKEQNREAQRRWKSKHGVSQGKPKVSQEEPDSAQAEAEAEAEAVKSTSAKSPQRKSPEEEIYQVYPRKVGKGAAVKAIRKALAVKSYDELKCATENYAAAWKGESDLQFCPHPATWFNQGRYDDDPEQWKRSVGGRNPQASFSRNTGTHNDHDPTKPSPYGKLVRKAIG